MPPSSPIRPETKQETYHLRKTVDCDGKIVRASTNFPVVDFFKCASELFNPKVGQNAVTISTSAVKSFVEESGLASSVDDGNLKATLTFL